MRGTKAANFENKCKESGSLGLGIRTPPQRLSSTFIASNGANVSKSILSMQEPKGDRGPMEKKEDRPTRQA